MRRLLDTLYRLSGASAAFFLCAICGIVLLQVGANMINAIAGWLTGEPIGLVIPSYAEIAGFFLAAASFLALAYTLRGGGHIRVVLVIQRLGAGPRRLVELWCTAAGAALAGYFAWFAVLMVLDSIEFGDVSPGIVPVALWLPQSAMAAGLVVLTISLVDNLVAVIRGDTSSYAAGEAADEASFIGR